MIYFCRYKKQVIKQGKAIVCCLNKKKCGMLKIFNSINHLKIYLGLKQIPLCLKNIYSKKK